MQVGQLLQRVSKIGPLLHLKITLANMAHGRRPRPEEQRGVEFLGRGFPPLHAAGDLGGAVISPSAVWGESPATLRFDTFQGLRKRLFVRFFGIIK